MPDAAHKPRIPRVMERVQTKAGSRALRVGTLLYIAPNGLARVRWDGNQTDTYLSTAQLDCADRKESNG